MATIATIATIAKRTIEAGVAAALWLAVCTVAACGGEDRPVGACEPSSSSDSLLPFDVGNAWTYEVTDLGTFEKTTKSQSIAMVMNHPADGMPVSVQLTSKAKGTTESWFRREDDVLQRLFLEERDVDGVFKTASTYTPHKVRVDETPARLMQGAMFTEDYSETEEDENGVPIAPAVPKTELWEVLEASVQCPGEEFVDRDCVHLRRTRTSGGSGLKEFWFSKGIGKIREEGGQVEQLTSCSL